MGRIRRLWGGRPYHYWRSARDWRALRAELAADRGHAQSQFPERVAIFFIGTNRYLEYFPRFHRSLEQHFLPATPKTFFVLTDRTDAPFLAELAARDPDGVVPIAVEHEPFPRVCLLKFEFMLRAASRLDGCSHCVYIDADCHAVRTVTERRLFHHDRPLFAVRHYNFVGRSPGRDALEMRPESAAAFGPEEQPETYWQACFWGGQRRAFVDALETLAERTRRDLAKGIVARWWDESFLVKYSDEERHRVHTCAPDLAWPEHKPMPLPFRPLLVHTNANPPESTDRMPLKAQVRRQGLLFHRSSPPPA